MKKSSSYLVLLAALLCGCRVFSSRSSAPPPLSKEEPQIRRLPSALQLPADTVLSDKTVVRNQRLYRINDGIPWTGKVVGYHPNGQKEFELRYREGQREGLSNWWSGEGWISHQRTYSADKLQGSWIQWYKLGNPQQEQVYRQGQEIYRRGWWPNGQLNFEVEFEANIEKYRKVWDEQGQTTQETGKPTQASLNRPPLPRQLSSRTPHTPLDIPKPSPPTVSPQNPTPQNPTPQNPTPQNPTPQNPTPQNPTPQNPTPQNPAPQNPASTDTPEQPTNAVSWSELRERAGLYYLKNQKKPFTGKAILVAPNGGRKWAVAFKNGILGDVTDHSRPPVEPKKK